MPTMLRFRDSSIGVDFEFSDAVVAVLLLHRQKAIWNVERGGLLFANANVTDRVLIDSVSPPHSKDRATPFSLSLNPGRCKEEITAANEAGKWFVGYWHTHPERRPMISGADISAFSNNLKFKSLQLTALLAVIVGNSGDASDLAAYRVTTESVGRLEMELPR